jgi:hypothetical protein
MIHPEMSSETPDVIVNDVLDLAEYTDRGVVITLRAPGGRVRLHLTTATGELLCERIADALECRYGDNEASIENFATCVLCPKVWRSRARENWPPQKAYLTDI